MADAAGKPARQRRQSQHVDWRAHFNHYLTRPLLQLGPIAFASAIIAIIATAWLQRDEGHLTAETGLGYWFGIIGAVIMLVLVAYPFRKRLAFMSRLGRVSLWFRIHMVLGIVGPTFVVLHTNFKLGSLNSRLALFTMLIVVASGIVGRYLYAKVHKGLYGRHAELRDILADIGALKSSLGHEIAGLPDLLKSLEEHAARASAGSGLLAALTSGPRAAWTRSKAVHEIERAIRASPAWRNVPHRQRRAYVKEIDQRLRLFFAAVRKAERLAVFDRLFSLWHHLHLPLFVMLALTVVIHIIAVHRY
ncbi:MAG: pyridine nucleotide-disulfide oxidoreductase [Hyphomicrobium sp.]|nr:pyridine nucleotide-disulfide oxidoreductase [Hyphomicrobium sp.]